MRNWSRRPRFRINAARLSYQKATADGIRLFRTNSLGHWPMWRRSQYAAMAAAAPGSVLPYGLTCFARTHQRGSTHT
jgi:hypothetical protein